MVKNKMQIFLSLLSMFILILGFQNCESQINSQNYSVLGADENSVGFEVSLDESAVDLEISIPEGMEDGIAEGALQWFFIDDDGNRFDFDDKSDILIIEDADLSLLSAGTFYLKLPEDSEYGFFKFKLKLVNLDDKEGDERRLEPVIGVPLPKPDPRPPVVGLPKPKPKPPVVGLPKPKPKPPVIGLPKPKPKPPVIGLPKPKPKPPVVGLPKPKPKPPVIGLPKPFPIGKKVIGLPKPKPKPPGRVIGLPKPFPIGKKVLGLPKPKKKSVDKKVIGLPLPTSK